tara:strand:+ start:1247 stop:2941 length:1695 start_codon:yes stop_codon:yes gene_type:complete
MKIPKISKISKKNKFIGLSVIGLITILIVVLIINPGFFSSSTRILKIVPKDTPGVIILDTKSFIKKGELDEISDTKVFKLFIKLLKEENKKLAKYLGEIADDPKLTGIDFRSDVVAFPYIDNTDIEDSAFVIAFGIRDENDFKDFTDEIIDLSNTDLKLEEEDNYSFYAINRDVILGWDDSKALFIGGSGDLEDILENLLELKRSESIVSNKDFKKFSRKKGDLSLWFSTDNNIIQQFIKAGSAGDIYYGLYDDLFYENNINDFIAGFANFKLGMNLNFNDDNISLKTDLFFSEDAKDMIEKSGFSDVSFNKKLLNYFPKDNFAAASFAIDFENLIDFLPNYDIIFDQLSRGLEKETGLEIEINEILDGIGGSFIVSLLDFNYADSYYRDDFIPIVSFAMDLNLTKSLQSSLEYLVNLIPGVRGYNDYFEIDADGIPIYLAFDRNALLLTNDKTSIRNFEDEGFRSSKSLKKSEISSDIIKSNSLIYLNLDLEDYPDQLFRQLEFDGDDFDIFLPYIEDFAESLMIKADSESFEFIFKIKENKGENSLKTIISTIDNIVLNFGI